MILDGATKSDADGFLKLRFMSEFPAFRDFLFLTSIDHIDTFVIPGQIQNCLTPCEGDIFL
jgi:hypothetical protein